MRESESQFHQVRGLRYHVRRWPSPSSKKIILLHGWMDVSASFQFLVDALRGDWDVYAPDWRGYGLTDRGGSDCYWFPDYLADLDVLLQNIDGKNQINLVGHSLGGNVACVYAGVRPQRVAKVVNLEGFGLPGATPAQAPQRFARWLDELRDPPGLRPYESFEDLASRLKKSNPRLDGKKAAFLSRHWGREEGGKVVLRGDPAHKVVNPMLYRYEEVRACWEQVTAPVLWVDGAQSDTLARLHLDARQHAERRSAFRTLRYETLANAGHMLHHDQPEALASLIERFLGD